MASEWAEEAERQAKAITRELIEVGRVKGFPVTYQKREARFALRAGTATARCSAHDHDTPQGMDWLQPRIDILTRVRRGMRPDAQDDSPTSAP
ncbi:hypothetical protein KYC5002_50915 [Archangium violaceum]|uniref:hypothetical protein n=1 Tax=Archangium violaceum TaxID=83451 RepID=UPI002B2F225F|nr:hypothetical protein KYC5002_50915 [Archangium gephyra]